MKSEREKMLSSERYNCSDSELQALWRRAKKLTKQYNDCDVEDKESLERILTELLGSRGKNIHITSPFYCDYGTNIHIGNNTEINHNCVFLDCNTITIGENVLIAPSVQIYTVFHPIKASERSCPSSDNEGFAYGINQAFAIKIGNNVWIGGGSIILPGVEIGDNTTIGAGSVVTKSIPPNVLAFGNPCRVIREL